MPPFPTERTSEGTAKLTHNDQQERPQEQEIRVVDAPKEQKWVGVNFIQHFFFKAHRGLTEGHKGHRGHLPTVHLSFYKDPS